eukprot:233542_1
MEAFINFRMQASILSIHEYRTLLCNILNESNTEEFSCMVFNHLQQKRKKQTEDKSSNGLQINTINQAICNIVSQREFNDTEPQPIQAHINDLQACTLSLNESRSFLRNVLVESTIEEFSCMIFNHLQQKRKKQTEDESSNGLQINTINQAICNIVSQRELNDTEPQPIQAHINDLPDVLIQGIASYLPFDSYSVFQSCCRWIFCAANTPSALYVLDHTCPFIEDCIDTENVYQLKAFMKRFERIQKIDSNTVDDEYMQLIELKRLEYLECSAGDSQLSYIHY